MNEIQSVRDRIEECFDKKLILPDAHQTLYSPSGRYELTFDEYKQNAPDLNWHICEITVVDTISGDQILRLKCEEERFFHEWIEREVADYLLFSEALDGQSVLDLRNRKFASYCNSDNPFIWTQLHAAPDLQSMVVFGCYWACPFEIVVYDFTKPTELPLPEMYRTAWMENEVFDEWLDDTRFQLRNGNETRIITIAQL